MNIFFRIAWLLAGASPPVLLAVTNNDHKIEVAVKASYNFHTVLEDQVRVRVQDGVVTLAGTVSDQESSALAADTVRNLIGVVDVNNRLAIEPKVREFSDPWIAAKIRRRLLVQGNVSATNTTITVKDGIVVLTGTAEDAGQKDLTATYAGEIDHVKSVRNDLVVKPTSNASAGGEAIDDASITAQINHALLTEAATRALKTQIDTKQGIVVIQGTSESESTRTLVTKLAASVRGVKSVDNKLDVKP